MKIATYNVNSVNARMENLAAWLSETRPDIVLLQEIKAEFNAFPFWDLQMAGYEAKILGQKSYNGVAVLSRGKIKVVSEGLPGFTDENARYLEADVETGEGTVRVASIYLPNGNPPYNAPDDVSKFEYSCAGWTLFFGMRGSFSVAAGRWFSAAISMLFLPTPMFTILNFSVPTR